MKKIKEYPGMGVYHTRWMRGGICLPGIGIFINKEKFSPGFLEYVIRHEYGHYLDYKFSHDLRPFPLLQFYLKIGIPSFFNALAGIGGPHRQFWTEIRANRKAVEYFGEEGMKDFVKYFPVV